MKPGELEEVVTSGEDEPVRKLSSVQCEISALPGCSQADLTVLQKRDTVIGPFLTYWKDARSPGPMEREKLGGRTKELVRQR